MPVATTPKTSVGVRQLKNQLSAYLARVKAGEEIVVTDHGQPVARLISIDADTDRMAALVEAGIVRPARAPARRLPAQQVALGDGPSLAELVAQQRR